MARIYRMARMRERSRGTGPRTTVARVARLLNRSARACPSQCTKRASVPVARGPVPRTRRRSCCILRSYRTLASCLLLRVYRQTLRSSRPLGRLPERPHPANPDNPGHPASDRTHARDRPSPYGRHPKLNARSEFIGKRVPKVWQPPYSPKELF